MGWSSSLGLGLEANNSHSKKPACYEMLHSDSDLDYLERSKQRKVDMRFGTRNVRSLYRSGSLKAVPKK
jgi:hypothetical protein